MNPNQVLRLIESATPSACAARLLRTGNPNAGALSALGWQAGLGIGTPPAHVYRLPVTSLTGRALYEAYYWRAYLLAARDDRPVRITKGGFDAFTRDLRNTAYGLWIGAISRAEFRRDFEFVIQGGLGRAWREGAAEFGIAPNELTGEERQQLEDSIRDNFQYIGSLAVDIIANKRGIGKWGPFQDRINRAWANRYNEMRNQGALLAAKNQKMEWVLHLRHFTKVPCSDCLAQNGRVYRRETWLKAKVFPQSRQLECKGFNCGCGFRPAPEARINKGRPPRLAGQRGG